MFVVVNRIEAPPDELERIRQAFRDAAHELRAFEGFLGLELWSERGAVHAVSRWSSRGAFQKYPASELFRKHHRGMNPAEASAAAKLTMFEAEIVA